jgi:multiple sugar transport system permease protein
MISVRRSTDVRRRAWTPRRIAGRGLLYGVLLALVVIFVLPLGWGILASLREKNQGVVGPLIPDPIHWDNYRFAWSGIFPFAHYLKNTIFLSIVYTVPVVLTSALAGYGFARHRAKGRNVLFMFVLATTLVPFVITFIPQFVIFAHVHLVNTYWPWLLWGLGGVPFLIFLFRQFYANFPSELHDAAAMDGCGNLRIFLRIYLPNSGAVLAAGSIIMFTWVWGDYIFPALLLYDQQTTLGPKIASGYTSPTGTIAFVPITIAGAMLFTLPVLLLFFAMQKKLARGIVTTGLKG